MYNAHRIQRRHMYNTHNLLTNFIQCSVHIIIISTFRWWFFFLNFICNMEYLTLYDSRVYVCVCWGKWNNILSSCKSEISNFRKSSTATGEITSVKSKVLGLHVVRALYPFTACLSNLIAEVSIVTIH